MSNKDIKIINKNNIFYGQFSIKVITYGEIITEDVGYNRNIKYKKIHHKKLILHKNAETLRTFNCEKMFNACIVSIFDKKTRQFMILKIDNTTTLIDLTYPMKDDICNLDWKLFSANNNYLAVVTHNNNLELYKTSIINDTLHLTIVYKLVSAQLSCMGRWLSIDLTLDILTGLFAHIAENIPNSDADLHPRKIIKLDIKHDKIYENIIHFDKNEMIYD